MITSWQCVVQRWSMFWNYIFRRYRIFIFNNAKVTQCLSEVQTEIHRLVNKNVRLCVCARVCVSRESREACARSSIFNVCKLRIHVQLLYLFLRFPLFHSTCISACVRASVYCMCRHVLEAFSHLFLISVCKK